MLLGISKNRRRRLRVLPEKSHPVIIDINGENFLEIVYAKDISSHGACVVIPNEFKGCKINKEVSVVISLPAPVNRSVLASGKIRHITGKSFGISFFKLSRKDKSRVKQYVTHRIKDRSQFIKFLYKTGLI